MDTVPEGRVWRALGRRSRPKVRLARPPLSTIYPLLFPYFIEIVSNIFNDFTLIITPLFFIFYILNQKSFYNISTCIFLQSPLFLELYLQILVHYR